MKKLFAFVTAVVLSAVLSLTAFAYGTVGEAMSASVRYYKNNAAVKELTVFEMLSLAELYRPVPSEYLSVNRKAPVTEAEIKAYEEPAYAAASVIFYAAATNTKLSDLAKDFEPQKIISESVNADGLYSDSLYTSAYCLAALFAVKADFDRNAAVDALLSKMLPSENGWASSPDGGYDIPLTCFILSVLSACRDRSDVATAYLKARDYFRSLLDENGDIVVGGVAKPEYAAMIIACVCDYLVDDITVDEWNGISERLLDYQHEDGYFCASVGGEYSSDVTSAAFYGLTALYFIHDKQGPLGKLVAGSGFTEPDFSGDIVTALLITLPVVLVLFGIGTVIWAMRRGRRERLGDE